MWTSHVVSASSAGSDPYPLPSYPTPAGRSTATSLPWWQTWPAIVGGLLLCFPLGLIGLWLRPGTSGQLKKVATVVFGVVFLAAVAAPTSTTSLNALATLRPATAGSPLTALDSATATPSSPAVRPSSAARSPDITVPSVSSQTQAKATAALQASGLVVQVRTETVPSGTSGVVLRTEPAAGTHVPPGSSVVIVVAHVVTPSPSPNSAGQECTPGYSPCLPPAKDYDCAGGKGDGPKYVQGPVYVTGPDPYRLDADHDGIGCERP